MNSIVVFAQVTGWNYAWLAALAFFLGLIVFSYGTRSGIIARATTKEAVRQPLFFLLVLIAAAVILLNSYMPFFTFGSDTQELKSNGLSTMLICGLLLAVWTAGMSITNDIEGKTAMTLLSKPVNRRQFILGKYMGILQAVIWLFIPLTLFLCFMTYYKVGYDQREQAAAVSSWFEQTEFMGRTITWLQQDRLAETAQILPGVVLCFFQVAVLGAISVAIATRLPMVVNLVASFAIFVIGNLTPLLVTQGTTIIEQEAVIFVAKLIATVFPSLESFDIHAKLAKGGSVPPEYLGYCFMYGTAYVTATIMFAFIMFEDRDLA